jgi:hypothetical protein
MPLWSESRRSITILRNSWDKNGLTALTAKQAELSLGTIVSIWFLQENVLPNVSPRNFVLEVSAISLFLYVTCKSIRGLVLVTNCIYCVLSAFIDNRLVVNHLFISWRILLALLVKSVGLKLVIIMLLSSSYRTTGWLQKKWLKSNMYCLAMV